MLNPRSGWFRDLCCFLAYALVVMLWLDTGYAQQIPASPAGPAHSSAAVPQSDYPPNARVAAKTNPSAKPLPRAPLVQTPDFRSVISVGRTLSSVTVSGVVNNTLTITYAVYNLRGDPVNGVLLTTTLLSGVTFRSATPLVSLVTQRLETASQSIAAGFSNVAVELQKQLASGTVVKAYYDSPRLILASARITSSNQSPSLNFAKDLRKDDIRAVVPPGQEARASVEFNFLRGAGESAVPEASAWNRPPGLYSEIGGYPVPPGQGDANFYEAATGGVLTDTQGV